MRTLLNSELDQQFIDWPVHMRMAFDLAQSVFSARPNPRVGCVIVKDEKIIGKGWHCAAGKAHAEVVALENVGSDATDATVFVTLEPCAHTGRTGPCAERLIADGVSRVVIASIDPNPQVAGNGVKKLEAAGIEVIYLADFDSQAQLLNPGFYKRHKTGLPWVRCKLAMSLDGRTALANGASKWITGSRARSDVQRLRLQSDAIITGVKTVIADNPSLTLRVGDLSLTREQSIANADTLKRSPLRVVLDSQLRTPGTARLFDTDGKVVIFTSSSKQVLNTPVENVEIVHTQAADAGVNLESVLKSLALEYECNEVLVEAGSTLSGALLQAGLIDEFIIYIAPTFMGSDALPLIEMTGLQAMDKSLQLEFTDISSVGKDIRVTARPLKKD